MIEYIYNFFIENFYLVINFFIINLKTILPLIFAIYFFSYKEQKDVAISLFKNKSRLTGFLVSIVILILTLSIFTSEEKINKVKILYFIWSILILSFMISFSIFLKDMLQNINLQKTFNKSINLIERDFDKIIEYYEEYKCNKEHGSIKNVHKYQKKISFRVNNIIKHSEIAFQILLSQKKYNLSDEFSESLYQIKNAIIENIKKINSDNNFFSFILPFSTDKYAKLNSVVNHGLTDILKVTLESNNNKDSKILVDCFQEIKPLTFDLLPEVQSLYIYWRIKEGVHDESSLDRKFKSIHDDYIISTYRIVTLLFKYNNNQSTQVLHDSVSYDNQTSLYSSGNDLITLLASLIINAIEKNDLKQLTDVMNILFDYIKAKKATTKDDNSKLGDINIKKIRKKIKFTSTQVFDDLEKKIYKLCFLSIVKSIELGRYNLTGFLIKNTIKNFDAEKYKIIIEKSFEEDLTNLNLDLSKSLMKSLSFNLTFSEASFEYCLHKATLLLYYQEIFTTKKYKINEIKPEDIINIRSLFLNKVEELNYLNEKVAGLNKEFGLLFLKEELLEEVQFSLKDLIVK